MFTALRLFCIVFISIGFLRIFILDFYFVSSNSMSNTLLAGDFVVVNRLCYFFGTPDRLPLFNIRPPVNFRIWLSDVDRYDPVVFTYPPGEDKGGTKRNLIKRVVGIPGDTLVIAGNYTFLKGRLQPLPFESPTVQFGYGTLDYSTPDTVIIPQRGMTVSLNPDNIGSWSRLIYGEGNTVWMRNNTVYINGVPAGSYTFARNYYYVMGDNRNVSSDSRNWGLLPENNILGKPLFIFLSIGPDGPGGNRLKLHRIGKAVK